MESRANTLNALHCLFTTNDGNPTILIRRDVMRRLEFRQNVENIPPNSQLAKLK